MTELAIASQTSDFSPWPLSNIILTTDAIILFAASDHRLGHRRDDD